MIMDVGFDLTGRKQCELLLLLCLMPDLGCIRNVVRDTTIGLAIITINKSKKEKRTM